MKIEGTDFKIERIGKLTFIDRTDNGTACLAVQDSQLIPLAFALLKEAGAEIVDNLQCGTYFINNDKTVNVASGSTVIIIPAERRGGK